MARFRVVLIAVCCLVTGSYGDDSASGRYIWLVSGIFPVGELCLPLTGYTSANIYMVVAGINHIN